MKFRNIAVALFVSCVAALMSGCTVKYSFSGASIPLDAKTVSVPYFPNNAPMVSPTLSTTFVEALKDKFSRQTKLQMVDENGDFAFEGEIVGYSSTTASVSSNDYAVLNRLMITVKVKFTNLVEPKNSFNQNFQAFADYDSQQLLTEASFSHRKGTEPGFRNRVMAG